MVTGLLVVLVLEHAVLLALGGWLAWRSTAFLRAVRDDPEAAAAERSFREHGAAAAGSAPSGG